MPFEINLLRVITHILFRFDIIIFLHAKTCSMPHFIGASLHNFEIANLGIKLSAPLALDGKFNLSETLVLALKSLQCLWPHHTRESPRFSKCISKVDLLRVKTHNSLGLLVKHQMLHDDHVKVYNNLSNFREITFYLDSVQ